MKKIFIVIFVIILDSTIIILNSSAQSGWVVQTDGLGVNLSSIHVLNNGYGYAAGNSTVFKTTNYGINWSSVYNFTGYIINGIKFANKDTGYFASNYSIAQTRNGGLNWLSYTPSMTSTTFYCVDIGDANHIYAAGHTTMAYPPYQQSGILTVVQSQFSGGSNNLNNLGSYPLAVSFVSSLTGYITGGTSSPGTGSFLSKTTNGGINISSLSSAFPGTPASIYFINVNTGWIAGSNGFIMKTTNAGINWASQISGISGTIKSLYFSDSLTGWFCGQNGLIKKTTSGGSVWGTQVSNTTSNLNYIVFINSSTGYVCGNNGIILRTTDAGGITAASENGNQLPNDYRLYQNFPNPFNPTTTIKYSIAKSGSVSLKVFDVTGREVAALVNRKLSAGNYETSFNCENLSGGVYFYKIMSEDFSDTKRMVIIK